MTDNEYEERLKHVEAEQKKFNAERDKLIVETRLLFPAIIIQATIAAATILGTGVAAGVAITKLFSH